jgi:hypothetical protein
MPLNFQSAYLSRFLDTVGDGSGSPNIAVDGSVTPVVFRLTASPPGHTHYLFTAHYCMEWSGAYDAEDFGGNGPLSNGLLIGKEDPEGTFYDVFKGQPLRHNHEFFRYFAGTTVDKTLSLNTLMADFRAGEIGAPFVLRPGWSLVIVVQDDLTATSWFSCHVKGLDLGAGQ